MSGPYCKDCDWFRPLPFNSAECMDPAKIIEDRNGNSVTAHPTVLPEWTCTQWKESKSTARKEGEE